MRNASAQQGESEAQRKKKVNRNSYNIPFIKVMLQDTIRKDDFYRNTALQHCCDIVSNGYNILALQRCVALKVVVANRPVQHHLKTCDQEVSGSFQLQSFKATAKKCTWKVCCTWKVILFLLIRPDFLGCFCCCLRLALQEFIFCLSKLWIFNESFAFRPG